MTTRPLSAQSSWAFWTCGSSATQGPHQVAQKSSSTTLPRSDSRRSGEELIHAWQCSSGATDGGGGSAWVPRAASVSTRGSTGICFSLGLIQLDAAPNEFRQSGSSTTLYES